MLNQLALPLRYPVMILLVKFGADSRRQPRGWPGVNDRP